MRHNYFYNDEAERFAFIAIPKKLMIDPEFCGITTDAKLLYALMLDRAALSRKNKWIDAQGRIYIYYKTEQVMEDLNCANAKVTKLMKELEKTNLIERRRQGLGKPTMIYVKDFSSCGDEQLAGGIGMENTAGQETEDAQSTVDATSDNPDKRVSGVERIPYQDSWNADFQSHENYESKDLIMEHSGSWFLNTNKTCINKPQVSHTEHNNTEKNHTEVNTSDPISSGAGTVRKSNITRMRQAYKERFAEQLCYNALIQDNPTEKDRIEEILNLLTEVCASTKEQVFISGENRPTEDVRRTFMRLNMYHIQYVLDSMDRNSTKIRNIRQYLLAALYNAPTTMHNYYRSALNNDMANIV